MNPILLKAWFSTFCQTTLFMMVLGEAVWGKMSVPTVSDEPPRRVKTAWKNEKTSRRKTYICHLYIQTYRTNTWTFIGPICTLLYVYTQAHFCCVSPGWRQAHRNPSWGGRGGEYPCYEGSVGWGRKPMWELPLQVDFLGPFHEMKTRFKTSWKTFFEKWKNLPGPIWRFFHRVFA